MQRIVVTVNARVAHRGLLSGPEGTNRRRTDYEELAAALGASILDWGSADRTWIGRMLRSKIGFGPVAALMIFASRKRYDVIWCFTEVEGLLLALLFKLFRIHKVLFFIAVEPVSPKSFFLLKNLKVWTHFTAVLPTNTYQAYQLVSRGNVPADKVVILPYQVDCQFFTRNMSRSVQPERPLVVAVGLESRDYGTLIEAVTGLDIDVFIAAASFWSGDHAEFPASIPSNVTVGSCNYTELHDLYARAVLAVVPLRDSPYQHGITAIQEAMAMSLPVIVTRTRGQSDVVIDRRQKLRSNPSLQTQGGFAQMFKPESTELRKSNGFYVGPEDAKELKKCICYLVEHRDTAARLGIRGQRFAREILSVELFVKRATQLVAAARDGMPIHPAILYESSVSK